VTPTLWVWRHPRAHGAQERCIGRTDLPVDRRRAKRLAHRLRDAARRHGLAREVWTSPLARSCAVGRWLRRWGWRHRIDDRLAELHFGDWDGRPWSAIGAAEVDTWVRAFAHHAPGGGESLERLTARALHFVADHADAPALLVVGHAGWMQALRWHAEQGRPPHAHEWPAPPRHGELWRLAVLRAAPE